jgi:hypothetical protein
MHRNRRFINIKIKARAKEGVISVRTPPNKR